MALLIGLGLALRVAAARGDLWLDEIWSFTLVARTHSYADIVFALPYDNNHVLNSLWLRAIGPSAPPLLVRLPAILFGLGSIVVAARLGRRISRSGEWLGAAFIALDVVFVEFSSEARGYAGLIFGTLAALDALESYLATGARRSLWLLSGALLLGTFSHLMMLESGALVGAVALVRLVLRFGWRGPWLGAAIPIAVAVFVGCLPPVLCLWISATSGPIHMGLGAPFSWGSLSEGLGGAVRFLLGFWPEALPPLDSGLLLIALGACILWLLRVLPTERRVLPVLGTLAFPLAHAFLHLPNQRYVRFHLVPTLCFTLFLTEILARMIARGGAARRVSLALIALIGLGQTLMLTRFLREGRGAFADATAMVTHGDATRVGALPAVAAPETAATLRWYARQSGRPATIDLVPNATLCVDPPDWLIIVHPPDDARDQSDATYLQGLTCGRRFVPVAREPAFGMSGFRWTLLKDGGPPKP